MLLVIQMGYEEYNDLIERAQIDGKYIVIAIDGEHESRRKNYGLFIEQSLALMKEMKNIFLNMEKDEMILARDDNMVVSEYPLPQKMIWPVSWNPFFTSGDLIAFYFYSDKMNIDTFKKVFYEASKKINNEFNYHLSYMKYETNDRIKGSSLLWCGYALQCLNCDKSLRKEILYAKNNKR